MTELVINMLHVYVQFKFCPVWVRFLNSEYDTFGFRAIILGSTWFFCGIHLFFFRSDSVRRVAHLRLENVLLRQPQVYVYIVIAN